jgi:hypothetical protein
MTVSLRQAYAHNDYLHRRPLVDALDRGFTAVEADLWLVGDELLVARDPRHGPAVGGFAELYLEPLCELVTRRGSVHAELGCFQLTVDLRSDLPSTYERLEQQLRPFAECLTTFTATTVTEGAITVVVTTKAADEIPAVVAAHPLRYSGYDGRPHEIGTTPRCLAPMISEYWFRQFAWDGTGPMPAGERDKLRAFAEITRRDQQRLRFWGTPDQPSPERDVLWRELLAAGIGFISTDDLDGLAGYLRAPVLSAG